MGRSTDALTVLRGFAREPWALDFYGALRRLEAAEPHRPRLGAATRPFEEAVRFGQAPDLAFAPASIAEIRPTSERPPRVHVNVMGLLGPNGPLPLHLTEIARERLLHGRDEAFARFLDLINHRFVTLFYRAWAQAQPTASADRPNEDRFAQYVGSLAGFGTPATQDRDRIPDRAKRFFAGTLARQTRDADGLAVILETYFACPVRIESFVGRWLPLRSDERSQIGVRGEAAQLGVGAVLGDAVWDRQSKFRIWIGPLDLAMFEALLPDGQAFAQLCDWVSEYVTDALDWDLRLVLRAEDVPQSMLDGGCRLGLTSWLGERASDTPATDLIHARKFA